MRAWIIDIPFDPSLSPVKTLLDILVLPFYIHGVFINEHEHEHEHEHDGSWMFQIAVSSPLFPWSLVLISNNASASG